MQWAEIKCPSASATWWHKLADAVPAGPWMDLPAYIRAQTLHQWCALGRPVGAFCHVFIAPYETQCIHLTRRFGLDGTPDFRDAEELITLWERWARGEEQANAVDADLALRYIDKLADFEKAKADLAIAKERLIASGPRRIHGYCNVTMTESRAASNGRPPRALRASRTISPRRSGEIRWRRRG